MNIFVLDLNPIKAAQAQCDKHVVKMALETSQLLCTAAWGLGVAAPYAATHQRHPCTVWVGRSGENFLWALRHLRGLLDEYSYRYHKSHACKAVYRWAEEQISSLRFPSSALTPFAQAMPEKFRSDDVVHSYRGYYLSEKRRIAKWTRRSPPSWWSIM